LAKILGTGLVNSRIWIFSTKDNIVQSTDLAKSIGTVVVCTPLICREDCPGVLKIGPEGERAVRAGEVGRERDLLFGIAVLEHDAEFHFNLAMFVTKGHWGLEEGVMMGVTAN
jgi:hypothetical protein